MSKPLKMNFCPCCGHALEDRFLFGRKRRRCPGCGLIFFRDPKVAAGVLAERDNRVVLVRRLYDPHIGDWALPAGFVEIDEGPTTAVLRVSQVLLARIAIAPTPSRAVSTATKRRSKS